MISYTKQDCDKYSLLFLKKLADCNSNKKNKDQVIKCRIKIYSQNEYFVKNCIKNKI